MPPVKTPSAGNLPRNFESLVQMLTPTAIHDRAEYENAMEMVDALTSLRKLAKGQALYLDTLSILMEAYEDETEGTEPED